MGKLHKERGVNRSGGERERENRRFKSLGRFQDMGLNSTADGADVSRGWMEQTQTSSSSSSSFFSLQTTRRGVYIPDTMVDLWKTDTERLMLRSCELRAEATVV